MSWKVNEKALEQAKEFIKKGKVVTNSDWSESQPSTSDENAFLKKEGWDAYAKWFLAYNPSESEETKQRFGFPYGDFKKVHRSALNAVQQRAGQYGHDEIMKAADSLVKIIDKQK